MTVLKLRKGTIEDNDWLFDLFRLTMREFIEQAWGWDELFQREAFRTHLPGKDFQILEINRRNAGGYQLKSKPGHLWLEMILLYPDLQRGGHGTFMLDTVKLQAIETGLPVKLACLRCNPAWEFYRKHEFNTYAEDENSFMMQWHPAAQLTADEN